MAGESEASLSKLLIITLVVVASLLVSLISLSPLADSFELKAYDLLSRTFNPATGSDDIVVVQVDQQSIDALAAEGVTWPWPRQVYAPLFTALAAAEAVFVDILYTEPSSYGEEDDRLLAEAIGQAGNVVLPHFVTVTKQEVTAADGKLLDRVALSGITPVDPSTPAVITPIPVLADVVHGSGNVMIRPDTDGVYRRVPLVFGGGGRVLPHLVVGYLLERHLLTISNGHLLRNNTLVPLQDGKLLVRFPRGDHPYRTVSAIDLVRSGGVADPQFRGKKVFLGLTAAGLYDLKATAVSSITPGVVVHAATLDTLLGGNLIRPLSTVASLIFMSVIATLLCAFVLTHTSFRANLLMLTGAVLVAGGVPSLLFTLGWYLPLIPPLTALVVSFAAASIYSYGIEGRERRFVRRTFSQYMDETVVAHLLEHPELIRPGGQRKRVTVFFADIVGFTSIAEKFPPEQTALMLHEVLNTVSEEVIRHHGIIDKYIGDCVMAFWGAPLEQDDDEQNACAAAIDSQRALQRLNQDFASRGLGTISLRVGIHTGDAIVGNLGSNRLFDYTVIGDTVNLASRLESANKLFGSSIMVSRETLSDAGSGLVARRLGSIAVKGKEQPVEIFELLVDGVAEPWLPRYEQAFDLFAQGSWREALSRFQQVLELKPDDGPARLYRDLCEKNLKNPPLPGQGNVIHMTEK